MEPAEPQLFGDVPMTTRSFAVAVVAGARYARRELADDRGRPWVVGPEVVPPVRDAVRLVDHEHPPRSP